MNSIRVGVDIAKSVFHVHGVDRHGQTQWQGKYSRSKWLDALSRKVPAGVFQVPFGKLLLVLGGSRVSWAFVSSAYGASTLYRVSGTWYACLSTSGAWANW